MVRTWGIQVIGWVHLCLLMEASALDSTRFLFIAIGSMVWRRTSNFQHKQAKPQPNPALPALSKAKQTQTCPFAVIPRKLAEHFRQSAAILAFSSSHYGQQTTGRCQDKDRFHRRGKLITVVMLALQGASIEVLNVLIYNNDACLQHVCSSSV